MAVASTPSSHRLRSAASTPSGEASTTSGSGVANRALSRASASVSATTAGSSDWAQAKPTRLPSDPSRTTRMPTPDESAEVSDSTSPS